MGKEKGSVGAIAPVSTWLMTPHIEKVLNGLRVANGGSNIMKDVLSLEFLCVYL